MKALGSKYVPLVFCLVAGAMALFYQKTRPEQGPMTPKQTQGKPVTELRAQDLEVCGINLGMSRQEIKRLKSSGPKPIIMKDGAALSYVFGSVVDQKVEAYETDSDHKTCRMTGWLLRCHKLNLELHEGQRFEDGGLLRKAFGAPDRVESNDESQIWCYDKLQLTVSSRKNRFDVFVVGRAENNN